MKIHLMGAYSFHMDGQTHRQTDVTKLIATFRSLANAPKSRWFRAEIPTLSVFSAVMASESRFSFMNPMFLDFVHLFVFKK